MKNKNNKKIYRKELLRSFQKGVFFGLGAFLCGGFIYAIVFNVDDVSTNYTSGGILTANHFNSVVGTLKGIYNDGGKIGIGTSTPQKKLDVVGNIQASGTICDSNGCIGSGGTSCTETSWTPSPGSYCEYETFIQISNCKTARFATGIAPPHSATCGGGNK